MSDDAKRIMDDGRKLAEQYDSGTLSAALVMRFAREGKVIPSFKDMGAAQAHYEGLIMEALERDGLLYEAPKPKG